VALFQLNLKPADKELRWFAGLRFSGIWRHDWRLAPEIAPPMAVSVWGLVAVLSLCGLLAPSVIRPPVSPDYEADVPIGVKRIFRSPDGRLPGCRESWGP
jgi:hypothetical protein